MQRPFQMVPAVMICNLMTLFRGSYLVTTGYKRRLKHRELITTRSIQLPIAGSFTTFVFGPSPIRACFSNLTMVTAAIDDALRQAEERGCERDTGTANGQKVNKKLRPATEKSYDRILAFWKG